MEQALGLQHPSVASPLLGLAELYSSQDLYKKAIPLYRRCIKIREKQALDHPSLAATFESYSKLLEKTNNKEEAKQMRERAQAIYNRNAKD